MQRRSLPAAQQQEKWQHIIVASTLYRFDINVRSSIVLGLVGAGGIGFELIMTMRLFRYHEMFTILIIIFIVVILSEWASNSIRTHIIGEEVLK